VNKLVLPFLDEMLFTLRYDKGQLIDDYTIEEKYLEIYEELATRNLPEVTSFIIDKSVTLRHKILHSFQDIL